MNKAITAALWAGGFVLVCFLGVNVYQIWDLYSINGMSDIAGFPVTCYRRGGIIGIVSFHKEDALMNYFFATAVAVHVALGVFALFNSKAIFRRVFKAGQ